MDYGCILTQELMSCEVVLQCNLGVLNDTHFTFQLLHYDQPFCQLFVLESKSSIEQKLFYFG